jgi:hypothetical protein
LEGEHAGQRQYRQIEHIAGGDPNLPPTGRGWVATEDGSTSTTWFSVHPEFEKKAAERLAAAAATRARPSILRTPTPTQGDRAWSWLRGLAVLFESKYGCSYRYEGQNDTLKRLQIYIIMRFAHLESNSLSINVMTSTNIQHPLSSTCPSHHSLLQRAAQH